MLRNIKDFSTLSTVHPVVPVTSETQREQAATDAMRDAAPDLYEALVKLRKQAAVDLRRLGLAPDEIAQELQEADAALAKARGE